MPDQVHEIDALRRRALDLLRRHDSYMPTGAVAYCLAVPVYAADAALEAARRAGQVQHTAGVGWRALSSEPARPMPLDDAQATLGSAS